MPVNPGIFVAAAIRRTDRKIVRQLRSAGATSTNRATEVEPWSWLSRRRLHRLEEVGALRRAGGRLYLDEERWESHRRMKRTFGLAVGGAFTVVALLLWLLSGSKP
jgi:hypothetical protein